MPSQRFFLTATVIIKDEAPYLAEWIEYHLLQGVEHVYVYDNGSSDRPWEVLADYLIQGRATLIHWPEYPGQLSAYNHAIHIFGRDSAWMTIIDVDEFIQPPAGQSIPDRLRALDPAVDQMLLPWVHFGSSGHDAKPEGLVIENYVHRGAEPHAQTKPIVRPEAVTFVGVHHCETRSGRTVDSAGQPAAERWIQPRPIATDMRINHYFTKSRAEFAEKIARGQSDGGTGKTLADFDRFETPVHDDSLAAMAPALRRAIAETAARPRRLSVHAPWSAQSELTPSAAWQKAVTRAWTRLHKALPADEVRLAIDTGHAALHGAPCLADEAIEDIRGALALMPVADLTALAIPGRQDLAGDGPLGRPCLIWRGRADRATTLEIVVEGRDAGGKPWRGQCALAIDPQGSFACLILSERTMVVERVALTDSGQGGIETQAAAILAFR